VVLPVHLTAARQEALGQGRLGTGCYQWEYFEATMGRAPVVDGPVEQVIEAMVDHGA
jgi:hypothetical protein